jgi:hypothetical protein
MIGDRVNKLDLTGFKNLSGLVVQFYIAKHLTKCTPVLPNLRSLLTRN